MKNNVLATSTNEVIDFSGVIIEKAPKGTIFLTVMYDGSKDSVPDGY